MMPPIGTSRHFTAVQQFSRLWSKADIQHAAVATFQSNPVEI